MSGQVLPDGGGLSDPPGYPGAEQGDRRRAEGHAEEREGQVLHEEAAGDLAGGEADRLEDGDVPQLAPDAGAHRPGRGQGRGEQGSEAEDGEDRAQEPVVAARLGAGLLPLGDLGDPVGAEYGDRALDDEVGVVGVLQAQPDALPGVRPGDPVEGGGEHLSLIHTVPLTRSRCGAPSGPVTRRVLPGSAQRARATEVSSTTEPVAEPVPVSAASGRASQLPAATSGRPVCGGSTSAARSVTPALAPRDSIVVAAVR